MKNRIEKERRFWNWFSGKYDRFIEITLGNTYRQLYKMLTEDIADSDYVLEIATGTGLLSFEICNHVNQIKAIDISPKMIQLAIEKQQMKKITNIGFEVGDSCNLIFKNNSFDVVIASNVLHLLFFPEKALSEIRRVLKPGGKAILPTFCHAENAKSRIISSFMGMFNFRAQNKWTLQSFESFIKNNDFTIVKNEIVKGAIPLSYLVVKTKE